MNMDMMQTGFQTQNQDGTALRPNFWPQFLMGQGGMVTPGQPPPPAGGQAAFPPASDNAPLTRFPSGGPSRPSLPGPLLIPVPAQPLHHAQSGGPLLKQMLPVGNKPERALSEGISTKVRKPYTITKQRERWTEAEHERFLEALKLHGRAWRKIEEHIGSKTAVQIRSHAQKFFSKLEREGSTANPTSSAPEIAIPPPRPKRKPSHPYPRKAGGNMSESESEYGTSPRTGFRTEGLTSPQDEDVMSPNNEPVMSNRSGGFSLWRHGSAPVEAPQGSPANPAIKDSAALTPGRSVSMIPHLADTAEQQNTSLKLFGQLLGPAAKTGGEGTATEEREQQRVAGKPRFEDACERHATPERSFLESGVSSAVIEGDATDSYAPKTSRRGGQVSRAYSKEGVRQQQTSGFSKDFAFAAPPPKTTVPPARVNQQRPGPQSQDPPPFMKQPELAFSQAPGPPPYGAAMSGAMPAQLAQMLAGQFGGAPQFGGGSQQWMPFGAGGPWNPAAFEQLAMLAQMNAYNSSNSNPFGPWGPNPAAMWAGFGTPQDGSNAKGGEKNQTAEEAAAESRAAATAVAAATMAAASAWWTLQNNAAAAAQMGRSNKMPFSNTPFQQQQSPASTPLGRFQVAEFANPPLMRMPTQRSMPRAAQSEDIPRQPSSPAGSLKESDIEQRTGPSSPSRAAHPSASAPELETEGGSSMGAAPAGPHSGAAIRRAERANKLRELKGRAIKSGNEMLADSSATPGVYADSCPWAASQHRRSLESSADKASIAVPKAGGPEEKGGGQKEEQNALEVAILKKLKKDERRRDKLRTQSASGSNEPARGAALAAGQSNNRTAEAAPQRGSSPPQVSNSEGGASGSGKEGSGGPSSNSSAVGDKSAGTRDRAGSEGASSEADRVELPADQGGNKESEEKGGQEPAQPGTPHEVGALSKQKSLPSADQGSGNSNLAGGSQVKDLAKGGVGLLVRVGSAKYHHHRHHHHAHTPASAATLGSSTAGASSGFVPYKGYQGTFVSITREGSIDSQGRIKHDRGDAANDLPSPAKRQRVQVVAGEGMSTEKGGAEERRSRSPPQKKSPPLAGGGGSGGLSMLMQF